MKLPSSAKSDNNRATKFQQTPPTYEESTQNVVEKYKKQVQYAKTPEDLLEPLLSDMGIYEKRKLIEDAPSVVFQKRPSIQRTLNLETQLEDANYDELAQRVAYRYHLHNVGFKRDWFEGLISTSPYDGLFNAEHGASKRLKPYRYVKGICRPKICLGSKLMKNKSNPSTLDTGLRIGNNGSSRTSYGALRRNGL